MVRVATEASPYAQTERRIAWLTLAMGCAAAAVTGALYEWRWAAGLMIGSGLAWLNFRWLKQGLDALVLASAARAGGPQPRVRIGTYLRMLFRYALIGFAVYAIFLLLRVPIASMLVGLCALGAATMAASVYEILHPLD